MSTPSTLNALGIRNWEISCVYNSKTGIGGVRNLGSDVLKTQGL